ncbi:flavoprotein [Sphaerisporangium dianthi]|uniref:Flavoprotein n=1 Tax=Sphaerisporangium dianthi TaxID=1436120 RepID=A0ABV9CD80_9ACTN
MSGETGVLGDAVKGGTNPPGDPVSGETNLRGDPVSGETNLLVGACGAANVVNLPGYLMALRKLSGLKVHVVMTATAARFLPVETVRLLSDAAFGEGEGNFDPGHARLAAWADRFIVLPATAHTLAQAAHGFAGSLLTATLLAYEGSAIFFPSMNAVMWKKPAVQRNVAQLRADGHHVAEPVMTQCWEIAGASVRTGPGLPSPGQVAGLVEHIITLTRGAPAADREAL